MATRRFEVRFDDNRLLPVLYGEHDRHLVRVESQLGVSITCRGNLLTVDGPPEDAEAARVALETLWERLQRGLPVDSGEVDAALRLAVSGGGRSPGVGTATSGGAGPGSEDALAALGGEPGLNLRTRRRMISPRSTNQARYLQALQDSDLVFGIGPAGTGKTYLAVAQAVAMLLGGQVGRIVLSRPAVEAGERLGFLPGDLKDKVDPYLRPLYDALHDMLPADQISRRITNGEIEIAPLAFMRGRTLANAFVILDEAQNTTTAQMKMLLTRLGEGGRLAITGDITQIDLAPGIRSGLVDAIDVLEGVAGIRFVRFTDGDVVRHPLVAEIVRAYQRRDTRGNRESSQADALSGPAGTVGAASTAGAAGRTQR